MAAHRVRTSFVLAVLFSASVGGLAHAQEQPSGAVVKYFVVPFSATPDENTLFRVAEQTLGAGGRYPEIFRLNAGRLRPDGTAFTNPASIQPGQVLQLPADARGAIDGPLPAAPPPQPAQTVTPAASTTSGSLVASLATGIGGLLLGLLGGLRLRRSWLRRTPPEPDPLDFPPSTGTLDLPAERPQETGPILDWMPLPGAPGEHSYFFLSMADTQLIAAVPADARINVTVMTTPLPKPVIIDMPEDRV
ncbi:LysM peptidoglycan-binding domain-containing protein [Amycolatopsis umgeniensis]|uniref:LysM domain-containing protein n=1 Tax=Amycolatopsis umgeniensis TaxID=336628 RepID=A0A841AVS3_9PSEU|nr:hypothetical protein [Amycolatopsis umgeniensis]MBB5850452.1 hypothetical protein [Amycolatopsis umgeniensis]